MSFDPAFLELMPETVVVSPLASVSTDGYGRPVFSGGSTYSARAVRKQELVRTFEGVEELSQMQIWIASTSTFAPSSRIMLNGSTVGPLMNLSAFPDEDGIHHVRAFFG